MTSESTVARALADALQEAQLQPRDLGAVALAARYAVAIDQSVGDLKVLSDLGPKLLATLTALGLTPAGRGVKEGGGDSAPVVSKLDELRERRAARAN
jgi:hypothetical protein